MHANKIDDDNYKIWHLGAKPASSFEIDETFLSHFLDLFGNPLAQDYDYRNYVIHNIKSLERLDRRGIVIIIAQLFSCVLILR